MPDGLDREPQARAAPRNRETPGFFSLLEWVGMDLDLVDRCEVEGQQP
jgi:hypothetical protein